MKTERFLNGLPYKSASLSHIQLSLSPTCSSNIVWFILGQRSLLLRESRPSSLTLQTSNPPLSPRLVANPQEPIYSLHPFKVLRAFLYPRPVRNRRRGREIRILGCEVTLSQAFVPRDGRRFQRHVLLVTVLFTYW